MDTVGTRDRGGVLSGETGGVIGGVAGGVASGVAGGVACGVRGRVVTVGATDVQTSGGHKSQVEFLWD